MTLAVPDATCALLRRLGMTTVSGNSGSTEEPFLQNFPEDFDDGLGLQESCVVAMAKAMPSRPDGWRSSTSIQSRGWAMRWGA